MPVEPITHLSPADRAVAFVPVPVAEARRSESPAAASAAAALLRQPPSAAEDLALVRTADNALGEIHALLHRVRVLAMRSLSGSVTPDARAALQAEADELARELAGRVGTAASNGRALLTGGELVLHADVKAPAIMGGALPDLRPLVAAGPVVLDGAPAALGQAQAAVVAVARDREAVAALRDQLERVVASQERDTPGLSLVA